MEVVRTVLEYRRNINSNGIVFRTIDGQIVTEDTEKLEGWLRPLVQ